MKLRGSVKINGKQYKKGDHVPWYFIYPFFLFHMAGFGGSGFVMAYINDGPPLSFLYMHGGIAIVVYTAFYLAFFGVDEVKWMFINAGLGVLAIYTQIGWLVGLFGKNVDDYPIERHVIPFLYFVLYTFLLRRAFMDIFGIKASEGEENTGMNKVDYIYIIGSILFYGLTYIFGR